MDQVALQHRPPSQNDGAMYGQGHSNHRAASDDMHHKSAFLIKIEKASCG